MTLLLALLLVTVVVFLFLQTLRATIIPLLTVPVSLTGTFILFPLFQFSINTLSLFGLVLAIGLVVDDAIVVVEAVQRHIDDGEPPREATLQAMREVQGPVIAIALVLSSVFVPVAFISGIKGRLFQQFALTIATSVIISAFNALSLSPALTALLLKPQKKEERRGPMAWFFARFNRAFGWTVERYVGCTGLLLRRISIGLLFLFLCAGLALLVGKQLPSSFLPEEDQGVIYGNLQLPDAASLQRSDAAMRQVEAVLQNTKGIATYSTTSGFSLLSQTTSTNVGLMFINLLPWAERRKKELSVFSIVEQLNRRLARLPAGRCFTFLPPAIVGIGTAGGFDLMLEDRAGLPIGEFAAQVARFMEAAQKRPELSRMNDAFRPTVPQLFARVDEDRALKQGVDLGDLYTTLGAFMGGAYVNDFNRFGRQWRVYLEAEGAFRVRADNIARFYVKNRSGQMVPLSTLVTIQPASGPEFITRFNLYRSAEITGAAAPGYSSGQAMAALTEVAHSTLPPQLAIDWSGMSYQEERAGGVLGVLSLSLSLVFLILAALYESWSLPFSILLSTPLVILGALFGLLARAMAFDVYAQIGLIMLIGLAAKNAILIVEFARARLEQDKSDDIVGAALQGARLRLRPILMTSFAFILGMLPLWMSTGAGGVSRRVLGTTVIAGLLLATLFGVFLVPVLFVAVERVIRHLRPVRPHALLALAILLLSGCLLGPDYQRPKTEVPVAFRGQEQSRLDSLADLPWWRMFVDDKLLALIREALDKSYDLKSAAARVEQARALAGVAKDALLPTLSLSGGPSYQQSFVPFSIPGSPGNVRYELHQLQASFSWEIDLFGRLRRLRESALADYLAQKEARHGVIVSLIGELAQSYFELCTLDEQLAIAERTVASRRETLHLFEELEEGGVGNHLQTASEEANLTAAAAAIPNLEQQIAIKENQLAILIGRPPGPILRNAGLLEHPVPLQPPAGLPAALLERRPDLRQAEAGLIAANAQVGAALAQFFPQLTFSLQGGLESTSLSALFGASAATFGVGLLANYLLPLLNGFQVKHRYRAQKENWRALVASYQQLVLNALGEVSNALVSIEKLRQERTQREAEVSARKECVALAKERFRNGVASYLDVVQAEQNLFPAELQLAQTTGTELVAMTRLYRALGGGWQEEVRLPGRAPDRPAGRPSSRPSGRMGIVHGRGS
jgi:NodT family efflux transporter outer membrane factor (OMF) lipoprotein